MNLYKISQNINEGYDTFDSAVVAAPSAEEAKQIHPVTFWDEGANFYSTDGLWANSPDEVHCELIGRATAGIKKGVIVASFSTV